MLKPASKAEFFTLIGATANGHADVVRRMLARGVSVDITAADMNLRSNDKKRNSIFEPTDTPLLRAVKSSADLETVRVLLEHGADTTISDSHGKTARIIAVTRERKDIVELLDSVISQ